jgi:hypothetical protein
MYASMVYAPSTPGSVRGEHGAGPGKLP